MMNEKNHSSSSSHGKAAPSSGTWPGGWPVEVTPGVLKHSDRVQQLFEHALARGWISEDDRQDFFAVARACRRGAEFGRLRKAGAKFTSVIKSKDWRFACDEDRYKAATAIEQLDAGSVGSEVPGLARAE